MRPLAVWPTNTFQSPNVATRVGFASSFFPDFSVFLGAASASGGPETARAARQRTEARERRISADKWSVSVSWPETGFRLNLGSGGSRRGLLPRDRGEIPASAFPAGTRLVNLPFG